MLAPFLMLCLDTEGDAENPACCLAEAIKKRVSKNFYDIKK